MSKLMIALIAGTFAAGVAAETGPFSPTKDGDHGTPLMHAAETAKNVQASKSVSGLASDGERQQAAADATKAADQGTPVLRAQEASRNVSASASHRKVVANAKAGQEAVKDASKGSTK